MTQMHLFETLVMAIVFAGVFGGLINFYLSRRIDSEDTTIWKSITLGIGASSLVPLFLTTISSHLIEDIRTAANDDQSKNILVFLGFCLIAAISSKAFIQSISKRILDEAREAKKTAQAASKKASEVQSAVEPILEKETEREPVTTKATVATERLHLSSEEWDILKRLATGEKLLRTRSSLARETGMSHAEVAKIMEVLRDKNLVARKEMKKADESLMHRWHITPSGRDAVEQHLAQTGTRQNENRI